MAYRQISALTASTPRYPLRHFTAFVDEVARLAAVGQSGKRFPLATIVDQIDSHPHGAEMAARLILALIDMGDIAAFQVKDFSTMLLQSSKRTPSRRQPPPDTAERTSPPLF